MKPGGGMPQRSRESEKLEKSMKFVSISQISQTWYNKALRHFGTGRHSGAYRNVPLVQTEMSDNHFVRMAESS